MKGATDGGGACGFCTGPGTGPTAWSSGRRTPRCRRAPAGAGRSTGKGQTARPARPRRSTPTPCRPTPWARCSPASAPTGAIRRSTASACPARPSTRCPRPPWARCRTRRRSTVPACTNGACPVRRCAGTGPTARWRSWTTAFQGTSPSAPRCATCCRCAASPGAWPQRAASCPAWWASRRRRCGAPSCRAPTPNTCAHCARPCPRRRGRWAPPTAPPRTAQPRMAPCPPPGEPAPRRRTPPTAATRSTRPCAS